MNKTPQELGPLVQNWMPPPTPQRRPLVGRVCTVTPIDPEKQGEALFRANTQDDNGSLWTYLPYGPFETEVAYMDWLRTVVDSEDPQFYAIVDSATGQPSGVASYLRIDTANGVIEVGHINFAPTMQRTTIGTEAMYLMIIDKDWTRLRGAFEQWLAPSNFSDSGQQLKRLSELTAAVVDPR